MSDSNPAPSADSADAEDYARTIPEIVSLMLAKQVDPALALEYVRAQRIGAGATEAAAEELIHTLASVDQSMPAGLPEYTGFVTAVFASVILAHAEAASRASHYRYAFRLVDACLPVLEEHGDRYAILCCREMRANLLDDLGKYGEALVAHDEVRLRLDTASEPGLDAEARLNRIETLINLGRMEEAIAEWDALLPVLEDHFDGRNLAQLFVNYSSTYVECRRFDRAVEEGERALKYAVSHGTPSVVAACWVNLGNACLGISDLKRALFCYDAALELYAAAPDLLNAEKEAACRMNRAVALKRSGADHDEVIAEYGHSLSLCERLDIETTATSCRLNLAITFDEAGRHDEALALFERIDPGKLARLDQYLYHGALGIASWNAGDQPRALEALANSRKLVQEDVERSGLDESTLEFIANRQQNLTLEVYIALELRRHQEAHAAVCGGKASLFGTLRGRLVSSLGEEPVTLRKARDGLVALIRADPELDQSLGCPGSDVHEATDRFLREWRLARSRAQIDRETGPPRGQEPVNLRQIQESLPDGWALVDFWWVSPEDLAAFVVTAHGLVIERLSPPTHHKDFQRRLRLLLDALHGSSDPLRDELLYDLYECLFAPLRPLLRGIKGLYLVPHGWLHALPLHACKWYEDGADVFLGDVFQIAYLPSGALLPRLPVPRWRGGLFSATNPGRGGLGTLPFTEWEAHVLQARCAPTDSQCCAGAEATTSQLGAWERASLVHFSCHGSGVARFSPLSHLHLRDDLLLAHDVMYRHPPLRDGSLVILNGCETAVRDWRAVDEGMGLMTAFLLRGAGLVLATGWRVNDCCAAEMAITFVDAWTRGESAASALRQAQHHVRSMDVKAIVSRCEDVYQHLSTVGLRLERARLREYESWVCRHGEMPVLSRQCAREAASEYRALGQFTAAERLDHARSTIVSEARADEVPTFDHPRYWAAFQLIGRVG